jgi:hypothetical protein
MSRDVDDLGIALLVRRRRQENAAKAGPVTGFSSSLEGSRPLFTDAYGRLLHGDHIYRIVATE